MDFTGGGTAIMLALAAGLWFLYLLPTWVRRREYLATERNATRLQRAIRVMAESAELPQEVRVEVAARDAVQHEKLVRQEQRRADAVARAELRAAAMRARAAEAEAAAVERAARTASAALAAHRVSARAVLVQQRLRRARRIAGLLLLAALVVAAVQLWLMATTGVVPGSWLVLAGAAAAGVVSVRIQRGIVARTRAVAALAAAPVARASSRLIDAEPVTAPARGWTPVAVPKPLYLERNEAPRVPVVPAQRAEELLRAAAAEAERALLAAHAEPEVVPFPTRPAVAPAAPVTTPAPSRFASMGIVGEVEGAMPDLDEVLRRRRSG
ncbi:hypothetical protein [Protaetiibacter larvae]|uniref:Large exoprotein n=1 Tax=Protaetiibacter larvae TaxID=2592654 RepID=A0A5C1Y682_9MICO|nr:hypothetical protein [Protaetiibacter larvae]QEO09404.1 hypothetical protein FLP23_04895 [Protaetiibacter larvae]